MDHNQLILYLGSKMNRTKIRSSQMRKKKCSQRRTRNRKRKRRKRKRRKKRKRKRIRKTKKIKKIKKNKKRLICLNQS